MSRGALVVFAKQPRPGAVKTRLCPPLSPDEAALLYERMLDDVLEVSARAARELGLEPVLAVHPPAALAELIARAPAPFRAVAQRGRDLAERMTFALGEAGAAASWPVLLRGSDSPGLTPSAIGRAAAALDELDVVLVPDRDGGYSLVGLRGPAPGLFEHAMSHGDVAEDTLRGARRLGLAAGCVGSSFDVDRVDDLGWLETLRSECAGICPRTLEYLDEQDLWRHRAPTARQQGSS